MADASFICDVASYDYKIYELNLMLVVGPPLSISSVNETWYERYGDSFGTNIASSGNYLAVTSSNFEDSFNRILIFLRKSAGGSAYTHFSVDLGESIGNNLPALSQFLIFNRPSDGTPRLMVKDLISRSLARFYNITNATLTLNSIGYYEMMRLKDVNLTINQGYLLNQNISVLGLLFNPSNNANVNDRVYTNWFFGYLWYWIAAIIVVLLVVLIFILYYCRRETLKKYSAAP